MAEIQKIVEECQAGDFFVDKSCINCDTCRQLAPQTFADQGNYSFVQKQPQSEAEFQAANRALLCCPTASIGSTQSQSSGNFVKDFPLLLENKVFYCGFNSRKSYGANSYFFQHKDGNWLIDSPRFTSHLLKAFEQMGGIKYIFLTHKDDIADSKDYAKHFNAKRIIHENDLEAQTSDAEIVLKGTEDFSVIPGFKIIQVPGHTQGHQVLLIDDYYLFTGDHLAYDPETEQLIAFHDACWYSWEEQIISMKKLLAYDFAWVLAGHGDRIKLPKSEMKTKLQELIARMNPA